MKLINKSDIAQAKKIFALAMFDDDLHKYFFPDEKSRIEKLLAPFLLKQDMVDVLVKHSFLSEDIKRGYLLMYQTKRNYLNR